MEVICIKLTVWPLAAFNFLTVAVFQFLTLQTEFKTDKFSVAKFIENQEIILYTEIYSEKWLQCSWMIWCANIGTMLRAIYWNIFEELWFYSVWKKALKVFHSSLRDIGEFIKSTRQVLRVC